MGEQGDDRLRRIPREKGRIGPVCLWNVHLDVIKHERPPPALVQQSRIDHRNDGAYQGFGDDDAGREQDEVQLGQRIVVSGGEDEVDQ